MNSPWRQFLVLFTLLGASELIAQPKISSFAPSTGPVGTNVTISGANFSTTASANIVYLGGVKVTVLSATAAQLTVAVPASATYAPISVTTNGLTAYSTKPFVVTFNGTALDTASFSSRSEFSTGTSTNTVGIAAGDLDGDGRNDVVVTDVNNGVLNIFRNTSSIGNITFAPKTMLTGQAYPAIVFLADLDGDGMLDLVTANYTGGKVSVYRNISVVGSITFASRLDLNAGSNPYVVVVSDLDGDGRPDVTVTEGNNSYVSVYRNTSSVGSISFASKVQFTTGYDPYGIDAADLDGDGKPELIVANHASGSGSAISVLRNTSTQGTISFASKIDFTSGPGPFWVRVTDLDGDGRSDIVVSNSGSDSVVVFRNTSSSGSITLGSRLALKAGSSPRYFGLSDMNGDGNVDIVTGNYADGTLSMLMNNSASGSLSFSSRVNLYVGGNPHGTTPVDIDGDGRPEILVAVGPQNKMVVLRNTVQSDTTASVAPSGPALASAGTPFWVEVKVGNPDAVSDLYGISLKLKSSQSACTFVDDSATAGTFLGTSPLAFFQKVDAQTVDIAVTKTSSPGVTGSGVIAKAQFTTSASLSSALSVVFSLLDISATNSSGGTIQMTPGTFTVMITTGAQVWPGDCNNDGTVTSADLLPIGLYYGQKFGAANNPGTTWQAYQRTYWTNEPPGKKVYADANGDGTINSADVLPIGLYYLKTHTVTSNSIVTGEVMAKAGQAPEGQLDIVSVSCRSAGEGRLYVPVMLKSSRPVYGVSFRMKYALDGGSASKDAVVRLVEIDTAGTVIGGGLMVSRAQDKEGMMDFGITKTAGKGFVGCGELVGIVMDLPTNNAPIVRLEICDIKAIDHEGKDIVIAGSVYRGEVSLPTQEEHQQPTKFELMANYPNPFNPSTTIMFSLAERAYVTLRVYDVLGREVVTLLDGERTGGVHSVRWEGKNSSGNQVESGVYYCRMSARGNSGQQFNQVQRMMFVK